jgi:transcriptional regulator with XRE-family HTH domain
VHYPEFLRQLRQAHLTLREFAELLGMNRVSLSNYAKKSIVPSHLAIIAVLLAEMGRRNIEYRSILQQIPVVRKKPRGAGIGKFGGDKQQRLFSPYQ